MKLKHLAVSAAVAVFAAGAFADNVIKDVPIVDGTAGFYVTHMDSNPFTDVLTFANSSLVGATASLVTISLGTGQNIDFISADLNGSPLTFGPTGALEVGFTPAVVAAGGDLVLTVMGTTDAGGGRNSTYSGTLNITPVPEPETYALMLAGLGAIGFMARRRRNS